MGMLCVLIGAIGLVVTYRLSTGRKMDEVDASPGCTTDHRELEDWGKSIPVDSTTNDSSESSNLSN